MKLREHSRSFFDKNIFAKYEDYWALPGNYQLQKTDMGIDVHKLGEYVASFSSTRTATAWCILDLHNKKDQSRSLKYHDNKHSRLETNILVEKKRFQKCKTQEERDIVDARLSNDIQRLKLSKKQIDKLISLAKYFQTRGFEHEAF